MEALRLKMEQWRGSVDQWSQIRVTLMGSRIQFYIKAKN
jgi:hypothetical protein